MEKAKIPVAKDTGGSVDNTVRSAIIEAILKPKASATPAPAAEAKPSVAEKANPGVPSIVVEALKKRTEAQEADFAQQTQVRSAIVEKHKESIDKSVTDVLSRIF